MWFNKFYTLRNRNTAIGPASAHKIALIINIAPTAEPLSKTIAPFQKPLRKHQVKKKH